ncbi:GIY-YIG nuclease superfamily protein [Sinorhizobium sp. KGO-5]|nr:GIY-YIG nuclease superfamily protein [Sinorhizobium sp. KGO-5]
MKGYVYILASKRNGTLYTGVTRDLPRRLLEHQNDLTPGFTSRYGVKTLVWFEEFDLLTSAIMREKTMKKWPRKWKLKLIEELNPEWEDISHYLHGLWNAPRDLLHPHRCARHRDESRAASAARKSLSSPRTWSGWIPVTSTGMRVRGCAASHEISNMQIRGRRARVLRQPSLPYPHGLWEVLRGTAPLPSSSLCSSQGSSSAASAARRSLSSPWIGRTPPREHRLAEGRVAEDGRISCSLCRRRPNGARPRRCASLRARSSAGRTPAGGLVDPRPRPRQAGAIPVICAGQSGCAGVRRRS